MSGNKDKELEHPTGYGALEYAYTLMAADACIEMSECRLLVEGPRRHFMNRRFDRRAEGDTLHMQSLGALANYDFNQAGAYSYEQAFAAIERLGLPLPVVEQQFRRMVFSIVARNQDDHVKNIAFLMNTRGEWSLAPAYDVTYSFNPTGRWTCSHQMTVTGKRDGFTRDDLKAAAANAGMKRGRADAIHREVAGVFDRFENYAERAGVTSEMRHAVIPHLRVNLPVS